MTLKFQSILILSSLLISFNSYANIVEDTSEQNIIWSISDDGTLTIKSSSGKAVNMPSYTSRQYSSRDVCGNDRGGWVVLCYRSNAPWSNYREQITSIKIEETIVSIGNNAFVGLEYVTDVNLPNTLKNIGDRSFVDTDRLTSISIPSSVQKIGDGAFLNFAYYGNSTPDSLKGLTSVNFETDENGNSSLNSFVYAPFSWNPITSIELPNSVTEIPQQFCDYCKKLTQILIPDSVTTIGDVAFRETALNSIKIPSSVKEIGVAAFQNTRELTSVVIEEGCRSIGRDAFSGATKIQDLIIPDSIEAIGTNAFSGCRVENLTITADKLQMYLDARGSFREGSNISCSGGDCKAVLEAWDAAKGTHYSSIVTVKAKSQQIVNPDGSISFYENGKLVSTRGKRIYTVGEAERVSKPTGNTFMIRYK